MGRGTVRDADGGGAAASRHGPSVSGCAKGAVYPERLQGSRRAAAPSPSLRDREDNQSNAPDSRTPFTSTRRCCTVSTSIRPVDRSTAGLFAGAGLDQSHCTHWPASFSVTKSKLSARSKEHTSELQSLMR